MLGNFRKLFKDKPRADGKIPKGILESLSFEMPCGYKYEDIGEGLCILNIPEGTSVQGRLRLDGSSRENLEKCKTFNDLIGYATNLQQPIRIEPDDNGNFLFDGKEIPAKQIVQSPLKDIQVEKGRLMIFPKEFGQHFDLPMSIDDESLTIHMKRAIFDSVDWIKFTGDSGIGFAVSVFAKLGEPTIKINITTDFKESKTVENVVKCIKWYNGFANGKVTVFDSIVNSNNEAEMTPYADEVVEFWNQLYSLENIFDVAFIASQGVYEKDVRKVRELYRSLIEKKPFRINEIVTKLSGKGNYKTTENIDKIEGEELYFRYLKEESEVIMGIDLSFIALMYIFGTKVKKFTYDEKTKSFSVIVEKASDDVEPFTATMLFVNKKDLDTYLEHEDENKDLFINAETIPNIDV